MLIYGVSGNFAHKKTIKQFLQPMTEQVWGEGCAAIFGSVFQSYYIFVSDFFSIHQCLFGVDFANICFFLRTASIFLGSIFDTGCFIFCSTVLSFSGTLPPFFLWRVTLAPGVHALQDIQNGHVNPHLST